MTSPATLRDAVTELSDSDEALRARLDLAAGSARIGHWDLELPSGRISWDDRLLELFGYEAGSFDGTLEAFYVRVHPEDLPVAVEAVRAAAAAAADLDTRYRVVLPSGETRWMRTRARCLRDASGAPVRLVGSAQDRTDEDEGTARVARVLETMPSAFFSLDRSWRFSYVNAKAAEMIGHRREDLVGRDVWELFPEAVGTEIDLRYRDALRTGQPVEFEQHAPPPRDRWYTVLCWPGPDGLAVYFHDGTGRHRALEAAEQARAEAEAAVGRVDLLGRVSAELAAEAEPHRALERLSRLVVPALADWCLVDTLDEAGQVRDATGWHADPALRKAVQQLAMAEKVMPLTEGSYALAAMRTGLPVAVPAPAGASLAQVPRFAAAGDLLEELKPEHAVVLPLTARGRTLGLLSLFSTAVRGPLSPLEMATAEDVASRAALSLDNKRLYRAQRAVAETLQHSLLTAPPEPDHLQIAVRYVPAAEEAQVGGDWYDSFLQPGGATVLTIGDVTGHDLGSAAAMGQVRGLLRGIAYTTGDAPAEVLTRLDEALRGLEVDTTASAVVLRIEQAEQEVEAGLTRVRWSNAGHPPPIVVLPGGELQELSGDGTDLLLGIQPETVRRNWEVALPRGATILLYTDGLVERRHESLRSGMDRLHEVLATLDAGLTLDQVCDRVLKRVVPHAPEDDIAVVAVRLHPQDRPRPAEAGPGHVPPGVPPDLTG